MERQQLSELWGRYGELTEVWFDGGFQAAMGPFVNRTLAALQPGAVAFNACVKQGGSSI